MTDRLTLLAWLSLVIVAPSAAQPRAAVPLDPIAAVLDAFKTHQIVALPDAHRSEQIHRFTLSLVRDPRFARTVNDIVVEFGNALHQDLIDRFVRGDEVPYESLRRVWMDTTQSHPGLDTPQPEEFLRAVRAVNATAPRDRQIRVLLGDPPISWDSVTSNQDHRKWIEMRETFPAELIRREVLAKHRRAVVLYGVMHFQRKNAVANFESAGAAASLVSLLEEGGATKVFSIWLSWGSENRLQRSIDSWPAPSLAVIRGTTLGAADFAYDGPRFAIRDGKADLSAPLPRELWRSFRTEDQYDAILYFGPRGADALVSPELCADPTYVEMRSRRMALTEWRNDPLKNYCGGITPSPK